MLMRDISMLLPSAIRTMRSSLRDASRQQIPFSIDGLVRQGLPGGLARRLKEGAREAGGERLVAAAFIDELFSAANEEYEAGPILAKWLATHKKETRDASRALAREVLAAWEAEESGSGRFESVETRDEVSPAIKSYVYRLF